MTHNSQPRHQLHHTINNTDTDTITLQSEIGLPAWTGPAPVNYIDIREAFILALASEDISPDVIENILKTIDEAIVNNEVELQWEE